jgi:hypothetical protein
MEELKIQQKCEDMIQYGTKALLQFPKSERYGLALDIKKYMLEIYELIITANKKYTKKTTLQEIDIKLEVLRGLLRLAANKENRYLPIRKYEYWSKQASEIGKMLGGWIKYANQPPNSK